MAKTKRPKLIAFRVSTAELELLESRAKARGLTVSDVIRLALFRDTRRPREVDHV